MMLHSGSSFYNPCVLQAHGVKKVCKALQNKLDRTEMIDIIDHGESPLSLAKLVFMELDPSKNFRGQNQHFSKLYWEVCIVAIVLSSLLPMTHLLEHCNCWNSREKRFQSISCMSGRTERIHNATLFWEHKYCQHWD